MRQRVPCPHGVVDWWNSTLECWSIRGMGIDCKAGLIVVVECFGWSHTDKLAGVFNHACGHVCWEDGSLFALIVVLICW